MQKKKRSRRAADEARQGEQRGPPADAGELLAVAEHAAQRAGQQCDRAGRVRDERRKSRGDERGKGEQRAAAGDRVDEAGEQRRAGPRELGGRRDR
jgi:hypothetical protein